MVYIIVPLWILWIIFLVVDKGPAVALSYLAFAASIILAGVCFRLGFEWWKSE